VLKLKNRYSKLTFLKNKYSNCKNDERSKIKSGVFPPFFLRVIWIFEEKVCTCKLHPQASFRPF
jgi:hypothetical protein